MTAQPAISSIVRAVPAPLHVLIIGGGIGGLTLAQGLKKSGVNVAVYERDRTMTDRVQGYRVHINPAGSLALHECLPAAIVRSVRAHLRQAFSGHSLRHRAHERVDLVRHAQPAAGR
jgi:2-polyprenyl-6-methoxyphenol hydroxylase-like FAD-dependent oxidoreductase